MARSRNRVGVETTENGDGESTEDVAVSPRAPDAAVLEQKKLAMQKELLKKKKAERRAHAKQRKQANESQTQRTDEEGTARELTLTVEAHTEKPERADETPTVKEIEVEPHKDSQEEVVAGDAGEEIVLEDPAKPEKKKKKTKKKKSKVPEEVEEAESDSLHQTPQNDVIVSEESPPPHDYEPEIPPAIPAVDEACKPVSEMAQAPEARVQDDDEHRNHGNGEEAAKASDKVTEPALSSRPHSPVSSIADAGEPESIEVHELLDTVIEPGLTEHEQQPSASSFPSEAATLSLHEPEDPQAPLSNATVELRPKKTKKAASPHIHIQSHELSTDAAALTIQKALKKRLIQQTKRTLSRAKSLMRNSSKILAEDTLSEVPYQPPAQVRPSIVPPLALKPRPPLQSSSASEDSFSRSDDSERSSSGGSYSSRSSSASSSMSSASSNSQDDTDRSSRTASKVKPLAMGPSVELLLPRMPQDDVKRPRERKYGELHDFMATRIQAQFRGMQGRIVAQRRAEEFDREIREEALREVEQEASVRIQARVKGYLQRRHLEMELGDRYHRRPSKKHHHHKKTNSVQPHTPAEDGDIAQAQDRRETTVADWPEELDLEAKDDAWDDLNSVVMPHKLRATTALFLSKGKLRVFCGTWNLHAKKPKADLREWIRLNRYHIVAVGTEECVNSIAKSVVFTSKKQWEDQLKETLGSEYVLVAAHSLTAIHNAVFVHESVLPLLHNIQSDAVATGLGNQLGNKGGVGIAFSIGHTSFAFINAHFDAHQHNVSKRNANFHRINQELQLQPLQTVSAVSSTPVPGLGKTTTSRFSSSAISSSSTAAGSGAAAARGSFQSGSSFRRRKLAISECFDRVFWYGDLNYRINGTRRMIDLLLLHNQHAVLRFNDQLQIEMKRGTVFSHFQEGPLHFRPTYKFDKHSNVYDSGPKQRIPSWTDRILYLSNEKPQDVELLSYKSHMSFQTSDHRPVGASFEVMFRKTANAPTQTPAVATVPPTKAAAAAAVASLEVEQATPADSGPALEDTDQDFSRVLAKGYKPSQSRSEVCEIQ